MKDTYYFQHDFNAIQDPKMMDLLSSCGLPGIGIYWILIEILHQQPESVISIKQYKQYIKFYCSFEHSGTALLDKIEQVLINTGLLVQQDDFIYSNRVLENKKMRSELSEKRSIAGKASAEARKNKDKITPVEQKITPVEQKATKERKGKEIKEKKVNNNAGGFLLFWESYPKKVGKIDAERAWNKSKDKPETEVILKSIEDHKRSEQWIKDNGQFIPNPATFINQGRWFDEIKKPGIIRPAFQQ